MATVVEATEPLDNPITHVVVDTHRWYSVITVQFMDATEKQVFIGCQMGGDGLGEYESYEEWERVNT